MKWENEENGKEKEWERKRRKAGRSIVSQAARVWPKGLREEGG